MTRTARVSSLLAVALVAGACATTSPAPASSPPAEATAGAAPSSGSAPASSSAAGATLYARLGGQPAVEAVVDDLLANVAGDARIQHRFVLSDLKDLRQKLVDFVCMATGGPCAYKGKDMKAAHAGQRVSNADFDALVDDLVKALDKHHVPEREKGELLGALAGMRGQVVEVPDR
jgi:hemoglobin